MVLGVFYLKKVYLSSKCFMVSLYRMTFCGETKNWRLGLLTVSFVYTPFFKAGE